MVTTSDACVLIPAIDSNYDITQADQVHLTVWPIVPEAAKGFKGLAGSVPASEPRVTPASPADVISFLQGNNVEEKVMWLQQKMTSLEADHSRLYVATHVTAESSLRRVTFAQLTDRIAQLSDVIRLLEVRLIKHIRTRLDVSESTRTEMKGCIISLVQGLAVCMLHKYAPVSSDDEQGLLTSSVPLERSCAYAALHRKHHSGESYDEVFVKHVTKLLASCLGRLMHGFNVRHFDPNSPDVESLLTPFGSEILQTRSAFFAQTWLPEIMFDSSSLKV